MDIFPIFYSDLEKFALYKRRNNKNYRRRKQGIKKQVVISYEHKTEVTFYKCNLSIYRFV